MSNNVVPFKSGFNLTLTLAGRARLVEGLRLLSEASLSRDSKLLVAHLIGCALDEVDKQIK